MLILGLTGSIAMGKSTTAALFRALSVPVHDADAVVHQLMRPGGKAVAPILDRFGDVTNSAGGIDRQKLGAIVLGDRDRLKALEALLHPLVREAERRFLARCQRRRLPLVVLDIPLLFETGADRRCDLVVVVTAPAFLQRQRVLRRPGMTAAKFAQIRAHQMSDREKRRRADIIIPTGLGRRVVWRHLRTLLRKSRSLTDSNRIRNRYQRRSFLRKRGLAAITAR